MTISRSPQRHTFHRDAFIKRKQEDGILDTIESKEMVEYYETMRVEAIEKENNPDWHKDNLEYDLRTTDWILAKVRGSEDYSKKLYAAMCNTDFMKVNTWNIITENYTWSCSWRHAGGIIADMRQEGDYIDWYCSGNEGHVDDEIRDDLLKLGWIVKTYEFE